MTFRAQAGQFCPVTVIPPMLHTHLHLNNTLIRRTSGRRHHRREQNLLQLDAARSTAGAGDTATTGPTFTSIDFISRSSTRTGKVPSGCRHGRRPAAQSIPSPGHSETTQIMSACLPACRLHVLRSLQCTELGPGNAKTC